MKAALFHTHGGPEVVRIEDVPVPQPGAGEVLLQVKAAGLNHLDLWVRRGIPIETTIPHIGGSDVAGVVTASGPGLGAGLVGKRVVVNPSLWCGECRECAIGQESMCVHYRILGEHTDGGFAEYVVVSANHVYELPETMTFEEAAAVPVAYMTAWRALLSRARLQAGEDVLVIGASGGTALAAVQIALLHEARVFAVTSGAENVSRLREVGAAFVYDRTSEDWAAALQRDSSRRGVDVVVENVGGATWPGSLRSLARGGRLVTYGATAGPRVEIDIRHLFWKQFEILGTTMASRLEFEDMLQAVFSGRLKPIVDSVMPLDQAREAHERLEGGGQFGKIILVP